jgi:hypothetical protein
MIMRVLLVAMLSGLMVQCGNAEQASELKDVQDIQSMSVRSDGLYDVRCKDGRAEVRSASEIRNGQVCTSGGGGGGGNGALICAARDNDGRDPWILAVIRDDGSITRLPGTVFGTNDQCRRAANGARPAGNNVIACISRDNDGRDPWIDAQISTSAGTVTRLPSLSYGTFDACIAGLGQGAVFGDQTVLCTARDNDGRDPWILGRVGSDGQLVRVPEVQYGTIDQCRQSLGSARNTGSALIVCGSRDRDGRDPWNLYSLTTSGTTRLSLTYSTLDQCVAGQ